MVGVALAVAVVVVVCRGNTVVAKAAALGSSGGARAITCAVASMVAVVIR